MKRVVLVRHAKTIQYGYDQDYDRTLTDRGIDNAERIAAEVFKAGIIPNLMISSPAVRTTQTSKIYAAAFGYAPEAIRYEKKLYSGMVTNAFSRMLHEIDDRHTTVMITGHNPTIYYFIESLLTGFMMDVPTCHTIVIEFDITNWADLELKSGKMTHRWIPDLL